MSVQAISWVLENSESRLGPRHVLISIANHADRLGKNAWPSVATIARESRLSEREVQYALRDLVKLGELKVERSAGPKGTNLYSLTLMQEFAPRKVCTPAKSDIEGVQNTTFGGVDFAPEPSLKQPSLEPSIKPIVPNWIPIETWMAYREMRNRIRRPMTEHAVDLAIRRLLQLKVEGFEPVAVLEQSILNSWQGLFAVKAEGGNGAFVNKREQGQRATLEAASRTMERHGDQVAGPVRPALPSKPN